MRKWLFLPRNARAYDSPEELRCWRVGSILTLVSSIVQHQLGVASLVIFVIASVLILAGVALLVVGVVSLLRLRRAR